MQDHARYALIAILEFARILGDKSAVEWVKSVQAAILTDDQWARVETEFRRRNKEIADAKIAGKSDVASMLEQRYEGAIVAVRL